MLPTPTVELVLEECKNFDNLDGNELCEKALRELREHFPRNTEPSHVLLKVLALNDLYSTRVLGKDVEGLAKHIAGLGIDDFINRGEPDERVPLQRKGGCA